jgi:hypothetical protein
MSIRRRWLILTAALAGAAVIAGAVYASASGGGPDGVAATGAVPASSITISNCKAAKTDFIANDTTSLSTTSTSYVAVPGMTKTVNVAKAGQCLVADVSAFAFAPGQALEYVSVTLDGNLGSPSEVQFAGDTQGIWAEAHAAVFAFPNVSGGAHTVAMVFRSLDGKSVILHRPAMSINHG